MVVGYTISERRRVSRVPRVAASPVSPCPRVFLFPRLPVPHPPRPSPTPRDTLQVSAAGT